MSATMAHRGPDDDGFFVDDTLGLAMRRLSIIGLANGRQPIFSEDRQVTLVMNGEIYNYQALRALLRTRGHAFRTDSDVEVAVHLYEDEGAAFVDRLRGMFAYALYDARTHRLLLGRDRPGKKPLYYAEHGGFLVFASEIKAIHASGLVPKACDGESVRAYLRYGFVPGARTLFRGICKLPAGSELEARDGTTRVRAYWDLPTPSRHDIDFREATVVVRDLLEDAVRVRLVSEVPLGAFLSGGVDSSAVVALMSRAMGRPVETFAVGFGGGAFDELASARTVATHLGTIHHELVVEGCTPELLREINWYHDEPVGDPAAVPTFCLARFARTRVTVVLTGEGGDELFGGYPHYDLARRLERLEGYLPGLRVAARSVAGLQPIWGGLVPQRVRKGVWIAGLSPAERRHAWLSAFSDRELDGLCRLQSLPGGAEDGLSSLAGLRDLEDRDTLAAMMYLDTKIHLADQLLMKVDKMTMAASLEARCPILDQRLLDFAGSLPSAMKLGAAGTKLVFRSAVRGLVPDQILARPKHGFDVPVRRWLLGGLASAASILLLSAGAAVGEYVDLSRVNTLWQRLAARRDERLARQLWLLLNLAIWHEQHWPTVRADPTAALPGRERPHEPTSCAG